MVAMQIKTEKKNSVGPRYVFEDRCVNRRPLPINRRSNMITMTAASGLYLKLDLRTEVVQLHMLPALVALPDDSCLRMQGFIPRLTRTIRNRSAS
jgi:hypothetical protein